MSERALIIAEARRRQPICELERKWLKAKGRYSNRYWAMEWIDLSIARGRELHLKLVLCIGADSATERKS
jgi:hypothetical protein